jgi:hypothetical protein
VAEFRARSRNFIRVIEHEQVRQPDLAFQRVFGATMLPLPPGSSSAIAPTAAGGKSSIRRPPPRPAVAYAVIARFRHPLTGQMVIVAAGLTQVGTAAAGEFLSAEESMQQLDGRLGKDWAPRK